MGESRPSGVSEKNTKQNDSTVSGCPQRLPFRTAVKRLRALEDENGHIKQLLAEAILDNSGQKDLLSKNGNARRKA